MIYLTEISRIEQPISAARPVSVDRLLVYLSGSVKKGSGDARAKDDFWTDDDEEAIVTGIKGRKAQLLNPSKSVLRRSDYYANFGCDLHLVSISDLILVDVRAKRGIGIGAEMAFAQSLGIPVISICPPNSNYRRDFVPDVFGEDLKNWIHPFVYGLSDYIAHNLESAISLVNSVIADGGPHRHPGQKLHDAIAYYQREREAFERS
jgi:hypothetical protein